MANLIPLDDAAEQLGLTADALIELRSKGEIHGYRDGKSWKFKPAELERFAASHDIVLGAASLDDAVEFSSSESQPGVNLDEDLDELIEVDALDDDNSVSVTDDDSPQDPTSSSTIVGLKEAAAKSAEASGSQLNLESVLGKESGGTSELRLQDSGSELKLDLDGDGSDSGSELRLSLDSSPSLASGSGSDVKKAAKPDDDLILSDGDDLGLELSDDELELSVSSSEELALGESDLDLDLGSSISLGDGPDSDVTLDPEGSGINLSPSDSGLSLEQTPPELVVGDDALELGEAEELDFGDVDLDLEDSEGLQTDDFLLTPVEGDLADDDSGSQVISLDTGELEDVEGGLGEAGDADGGLAAVDESPVLVGPAIVPGAEPQFSIGWVCLLGFAGLPLVLTGLFLVDVIFHMWSWDKPYAINSTLMDAILGMFGS